MNLEKTYLKAKNEGTSVRAIVVINPNNPTGTVLSSECMRYIIMFAYNYRLVIIADEVYQHNLYLGKVFTSFRKAISKMPPPFNKVSLVSFNSISKGYTGECGLRGGYMDFYNFNTDVMRQIQKIRDPCSVNVTGSIAIAVLCDPPTKENSSLDIAKQFAKERENILSLMEKRAHMAIKMLNQCKNVTCKTIEGAIYAYPRVDLPEPVIKAAKEKCQKPCEYFCRTMLEETGIITLPGSEFGQEPRSYHFRISLLIWDFKEFKKALMIMKAFCKKFFDGHI